MNRRRSLLVAQDPRSMRKAARNNKYLHTLRLKNLRAAVKKLRKVKKNHRNLNLKTRKIAIKKSPKKENEFQSSFDTVMVHDELVKNSCTEINSSIQQAEESLAYDVGNKHTRSFSKKCNEMASIYIPCDYNYELSVRKTWPSNNTLKDFSEEELHHSDQLCGNIREVMKDSLDLVLGYCFLYTPEETQPHHEHHQTMDEGSVSGCEKMDIDYSTEMINNSIKITDTSTNNLNPINLFQSSGIKCDKSYKNEVSDFQCCPKNLFHQNIDKRGSEINLQFPDLPEKCDDLNISEFLRPHLSPGKRIQQTIENECVIKLISKNSKQNESLFHKIYPKVTHKNNEAVVKINKDHSYAKINKELTMRENLIQINSSDSNSMLFVNKESAPKQYRNPKRMSFNSIKEDTFQYASRNKNQKLDFNDSESYQEKSISTKNNQNFKTQSSCNKNTDIKLTNNDYEDENFLKDLVMNTSLLYSMLCGVDPEDVAFYINSRQLDPDQWAIDILDSINIH